jgi:hypothetical protein
MMPQFLGSILDGRCDRTVGWDRRRDRAIRFAQDKVVILE